jgi:FkbM family methyltransferase
MSHFNLNHITNVIGNKEHLVIFDIGAFNFGDSIMLKTKFPNSSVHAIEAFPYNVEKYGNRAKSKGVLVHNLAISDKNGETTFYNSTTINGTEWTCSGSILEPTYETHPGLKYNDDGIVVETMTLENFCKNNGIGNIDVIHMDIQGAEYYAVKGFGESIRPKLLFCETCEYKTYKNSLSLEALDELLFEMGYEIMERLPYDTLYILKD